MAKKTTPAESLEVIPAAKSGELMSISPARLNEVSTNFGIYTDDLTELTTLGADSLNRSMFEATRAGLAFIKINEQLSLGHGGARNSNSDSQNLDRPLGFVAWMEQHGLPKDRVYGAMKIAKFVAQLPADQLDDVLRLGKVKVMLLASLPQDVIDAAAESGDNIIDKADLMTTAELKEEIKSLKRREKNYEAEIERAEIKLKALSNKDRSSGFLERTEDVRHECMALQLEGELALDSVRKLFDEVNLEGPDAPEWRVQMEQIWVIAHLMSARASALVDYVRETCKVEDMPDRINGTHVLTADECQRWLFDANVLTAGHTERAEERAKAREADRPRKRGRPAGSTNKTKE